MASTRARIETLTDQASSRRRHSLRLCVLKPTRDTALDATDLRAAIARLTGGALGGSRPGLHAIVAFRPHPNVVDVGFAIPHRGFA
jgi:hypothetical protein